MRVRTAETSDAAAIAEIYAPIVRETVISFEAGPPSAGQMAARVEHVLKTHPWLVAEEDGRILGYAYAGPHRSRAAYRWASDVSVYVRPEAQRRGVGGGLYRALFEILRRQNLAAAYAGIGLPNPASVALHDSLGFGLIGIYRKVGFKFGAWHDVGWWHLALADLGNRPPEPIPFPSLDSSER
ncbi:MAG: GNAT family N-acetyltransferase [Kiloniellales bacterium]|nr:GNAT family N-acetyltransferase [Kiloniellales bacterium]